METYIYYCRTINHFYFFLQDNLGTVTVPIIYSFTDEKTEAKLRKTLEMILPRTLLDEEIDA